MAGTFKDALYEVVHHSEISAEAQAELIGYSYSMLSNCANRTCEAHHMRGDKIAPLTKATQNFALLDYMERIAGRVAFELPPPGACLKNLHTHLTRTVSEFGDVCQTFEAITEDGKITHLEKLTFEQKAYEVCRAVLAFTEAIKGTKKC